MIGQELGGRDEHRAGQAGIGVLTGLLQRKRAVPVRQRHLGPGQVVLHPHCLGQRAGVGGKFLPGDVDLACAFPLLPDRGVRQSGIVRSHLVRGVIEQAAHGFLRNLIVDQAGAEGMPPLMRGHVDRLAEFITDVAGMQPLDQLAAEGGCAERLLAVGIAGGPR